jgi:hypothetical protein
LFFAITTLLLAACGGGGSGDEDFRVPTAPAAGVSITADNAELISADVLGTVEIISGFSSIGDLLPEPVPGVQVDVTGSEFSYPDFFVQQLQRLPAALDSQSGASNVSGVTISPIIQPCESGSTTISGDVDVFYPDWIPAVGDLITIRFNDCEEAGIVLNGKMSMTITELSPGFDFTPPYTLGLDVVLTLFSVEAVGGGEVAWTDGDMSMRLSEDGFGYEALEFWGNSITAWSGSEVETLTDYQFFYDENSALPQPAYSYELEKGKLASTIIGGAVSFQMTKPGTMDQSVPFEGVDAGDPAAGELWITTAADTSMAHVTALPNSIDVSIDVYLDDVIVENIMTTWDYLWSLL